MAARYKVIVLRVVSFQHGDGIRIRHLVIRQQFASPFFVQLQKVAIEVYIHRDFSARTYRFCAECKTVVVTRCRRNCLIDLFHIESLLYLID